MCRAPRPCDPGDVLLKLTGSSCSGKSTLAFAVADRLRDVVVHDFDEVGVPRDADRHWRHRITELWVRRALEYQERGLDLLLTGQSPLGEILAAPSAPKVDGIALCLVDVDDEIRRTRLAHRDPGRWDASAVDAFLGWAAWHRGHARDPRHRPEVITGDSARTWPGTAGPTGPPATPGGAPTSSTPPTNPSPSPSTSSNSGWSNNAPYTDPAGFP